jgi:hypothetical protein
MEEWRYTSIILGHGTEIEVSSQLAAPAVLIPGKESPIPTGEEARWDPEPLCSL